MTTHGIEPKILCELVVKGGLLGDVELLALHEVVLHRGLGLDLRDERRQLLLHYNS